MQLRFDGEVALVTGAAGGIGRALSLGFARAGADVVMLDLRDDALAEAAAEVRAAGGRRVAAHAVDVTDRAALRALAARVDSEFGAVRHLVNNAGVDGRGEVGTEAGDAAWDRVIRINLGALHEVTSAFVEQVIRGRGSIVNVGSTMSFVGQPGMTAYTTSKAAIHNFTQSLAAELAPRGVRVNMLAPGLMNTGLTAKLNADPVRLATFVERIPLGRPARPDEMVGAVLFACSEHASYMTGATLRVDGGWLAR